MVPPINQRLPEIRSPNRKADESRNASRRGQPFAHLFVILATPENDAAHRIAPASPCCLHDLFAVLAAIQSLNLPHIRLIFFRVTEFEDEPRNVIFEEMRWEPRQYLAGFDFVEGDIEFLRGISSGLY